MGSGRLGEILVAEGLSPADLARGLAVSRAEKCRLGSALVLLGLRTSDEVATALSRMKEVPAVRDKHFTAIAPGTRSLLPAAIARRLWAVPIGVLRDPRALVVAMRDPDDAAAIAELTRETGYEIRPAIACETRLLEAIEQMGADLRKGELAAQSIDDLTPMPRAIAPPPIELPDLRPPTVSGERLRSAPPPPPDQLALAPPPPDLLDLAPPPDPLELAPLPDQLELAPADSIDLTPATLDLPAPPLERPRPPPSFAASPGAGSRPPAARPIAVTDDLELDAPARPPAPRPVAVPRAAAAASASIGGLGLDEPAPRSGLPGWLIILALLVVVGGGGLLAWDYLHDDGPAPGTPLQGDFHCKRLDLTITFPGTDWVESPEQLGPLPRLPNNGVMRADFFARGARPSPHNLLVLARLTIDGAFAAIPPDQFQEIVQNMESSGGSFAGGMFAMRGMSCTQDTLAGKPLAVCRGSAESRGTPYNVMFLFWIASGDDAMVLIYLDPDDAGPALDLAKSVRLD